MIQGDTIRLKVNFKDFNGKDVDPDDVKLIIYDKQQEEIEQIELDDTNRQDVGVYFYDYVVPDDIHEFIFEFRGLHNNKPTVVRDSLKVKFI